MPLQNRVTPFGDIVAIDQRGLCIGNRGILHDPATKTLTGRRWASKAWIVCNLQYRNARRRPMTTRSWTELFFYDEAVALAAGHRPCFLCRRPAAEAFRRAWATAKGAAPSSAALLDAVLHAERLCGRTQRVHELDGPAASLPDGAMVVGGGRACVIVRGKPFAWSSTGYQAAPGSLCFEGLLTPPSTLGVLRAGYHPVLHPSLTHD